MKNLVVFLILLVWLASRDFTVALSVLAFMFAFRASR